MTLRSSALIATILTCLLVAAFGVHFAHIQNVWIDELTQLSGSTLPAGRLFAWLTGTKEPAFGVPADRMPPISYLIDAACYRTACAAPVAWRMLHLLFAVAGAGVATWAVARRYGLVSGLVTGLFLALSAKLTELGVEIRAYPIFFAITAVQIALLWRMVEAERLSPRALGLFLLLGLAAAYTHFFGLVSSMALFTGLFVARARTLREALWIAGAAALLVVLSAGLAPFIMTASAISGTEVQTDRSADGIALYFLRLAGHPANVVSPVGAVLFLVPLALLILLVVVRVGIGFAQGGLDYRRGILVALVAALASGLAVTLLAAFVVKGFNPLKPTYSFWILPVLAVLLGVACALRTAPAWLRPATIGLAVATLIGAAIGQATLLRHGDWFVHGPSSAIRAAVGDAPAETAIVYEGAWAYGFFPTYYYYHAGLDQWLLTPEGNLQKIGRGGGPAAADTASLAAKRRIIFVGITLRDYHDLRTLAATGSAGVPQAGIAPPEGQPAFAGLTTRARTTQPGIYDTDIATYERTER